MLTSTAAADPLSDNDLAIARVLVAAELLGIDFYTQSIDAKKLARAPTSSGSSSCSRTRRSTTSPWRRS